MEEHYKLLHLAPNADIEEVKASYRRLAKRFHPDAVDYQMGEADRFQKIHQAYQAVMENIQKSSRDNGFSAELVFRNLQNNPEMRRESETAPPTWWLEGVYEKGSDVTYLVRVSSQAACNGLKLVLPWEEEKACPRCLGTGHTLKPIPERPAFTQVQCPKCQSTGVVRHDSPLNVRMTAETIAQGRMKLKGLGRYQPMEGRRGDLIIEVMVEESRKRA